MNNDTSKFLDHLRKSHKAVWFIARWLNKKGYQVSIPPTKELTDHKDWKDYIDNGDLNINQRIEVKHLSIDFTDKDDWPFKDKFIVCAKHSFDLATPKPYAYFILNKNMDRGAVVYCSDKNDWYVERKKDNRYDDMEQDFYLCPLDKVRFISLH